jgi:hypothetical protein
MPVTYTPQGVEMIDIEELARRLGVKVSWVREHIRATAKDPVPVLRMGRLLRFPWGSPEMREWLGRR